MTSHLARFFFSLRIYAVILIVSISVVSCSVPTREVDVLIIGGGASGVAAGVQAARMGVSAMIVEETTWLGGMLTSAGVSAVDGNYRMPAGIFGEFRTKLAEHYGGLDSLKTGWVSNVLFEPSVGNKMMHELVEAEPELTVLHETRLEEVNQMSDGQWMADLKDSEGKKIKVKAKILIDGTELGDVAKAVGIGYDLGMESRFVTGEGIAPDSARNIIQDLTMVAILKDYGRDVTMDEPEDYDPDEFACTCDNELCTNPGRVTQHHPPHWMMQYGRLPNGKYMINWPIEGNDIYLNIVEMTPEEREEALDEAKAKTLRYVYFLQKELGFNNLGLADDEFPTDDLLPLMPYHRESRRIHGLTRFTLNHIVTPYDTPDPLYRTAVAVGDYPVDQHHLAYDGPDSLPKISFYPIPSYGLPLGSIIPAEVDNMLVTEKSVSVSNIVNGSTRLQPVVVQIGQAAGAIAALAVKENVKPSEVSVREVQNAILDAGGYIMPFLDVDKNDRRFKPYQRIGATGILRGEGRNVGWSNQTWLRADEPLLVDELVDFCSFYGLSPIKPETSVQATFSDAIALIASVSDKDIEGNKELAAYSISAKADNEPITRGEFALMVDAVLNPFSAREVDIKGHFVTNE
ncbi:MAG: FAD-dependent oxidoreductase [Muribaculaceae bacterium]|nr:FAD-dependent oxidoreductase [Muribaculaceae bacterium]